MLSPVRVSPPAETPVSLAEAKAHLRVTSSDDDALIGALIQAATDWLDGWCGILGRALVTQTWRVDLCAFPACRWLRLPLGPVQSITSVVYSDAADDEQTLDAASYSLHVEASGPVILFSRDAVWPSTYRRPDAVRVTLVAGYGDAADVPAPIKTAILLMVGDLYASSAGAIRRETVEGVGSTDYVQRTFALGQNPAVSALVAPYRRAVAL